MSTKGGGVSGSKPRAKPSPIGKPTGRAGTTAARTTAVGKPTGIAPATGGPIGLNAKAPIAGMKDAAAPDGSDGTRGANPYEAEPVDLPEVLSSWAAQVTAYADPIATVRIAGDTDTITVSNELTAALTVGQLVVVDFRANLDVAVTGVLS